MRRPLVIGAQKLFLPLPDAVGFASQLLSTLSGPLSLDVVLCPSFVNLAHVAEILRASGSVVSLGAQNVHFSRGDYTGQVSSVELKALGVEYVLLGHSELRSEGETNGMVNHKIRACLADELIPIVCVGDNQNQRESGLSKATISRDLDDGLYGLNTADISSIVIAYEPVWAIRAGGENTSAATPEVANEMHDFIRSRIASHFSMTIASSIRIVYGGSVDGVTAPYLLRQPSIDGLLVGTASRSIREFLPVVEAAQEVALVDSSAVGP